MRVRENGRSRANQAFKAKKATIVAALAVPDAEYDDLSPKGSVDRNIRAFIDEINALDDVVTTSSCSGRIVVFADGAKARLDLDDGSTRVSNEAGRWLLVSHDPIDIPDSGLYAFLQLEPKADTEVSKRAERFIHLKFEPFILHLLTSSLEIAQAILRCAQQAGFRESGIAGISEGGVNVAIRTNGIGTSTVVGHSDLGHCRALVDEGYLRTMLEHANGRFRDNEERIKRLRESFERAFAAKEEESKAQRAERKKREGIARQNALRNEKAPTDFADVFEDGLSLEVGQTTSVSPWL